MAKQYKVSDAVTGKVLGVARITSKKYPATMHDAFVEQRIMGEFDGERVVLACREVTSHLALATDGSLDAYEYSGVSEWIPGDALFCEGITIRVSPA